MHTYELFNGEERKEIYNSFSSITPYWQQQTYDNFNYLSFEANVSMDIDPHLPLRCAERYVSSDSFFLAMEAFFSSEGVDDETGEELPSVFDLQKGDWVVLSDTKNKISFVFQYCGLDSQSNMDEVFCKTVTPFFGFNKQFYRKGNKVFELATLENGEFKVKYVESELKFK